MKNNNKKIEQVVESGEYDDQFDLLRLIQIIFKSPRVLFFTTFSSLFLSIIYAYLAKPIWQGEFQIVLQSNDPESMLSNSGNTGSSRGALQSLFSISSGPDKILTEVEILESPSVLKPVFDFVKENKASEGVDVSGYRFKNWKSRLNINLIEDTSVLNITYKDDDKFLIEKVIEKISKEYQTYSGSKREKRLKDGIKYLENQISKYKEESLKSSIKLKEFSNQNNITFVSEVSDEGKVTNLIDVEESIKLSRSRIKSLEMQISQLNDFDNNLNALQFYLFEIPEIDNLELSKSINQIDNELARLRSTYKDNDPFIQDFLNEKKSILKNIKDQVEGILNAQLIQAKIELELSSRPEEVIVEFRKLIRDSQRFESTLVFLETNLQKLLLQIAKDKDPWKLISKPTVLDRPVEPVKRQLAALGLIGGIFAGSVISLFKYKRNDLLFYRDEYKKLLNSKMLLNLPKEKNDLWTTQAKALLKGLEKNINLNTINFVFPNKEIPDQILKFIMILRDLEKGSKFILNPEIDVLEKDANIIILTYPGVITSDSLNFKIQELNMSITNVIGWIYFADENFKL